VSGGAAISTAQSKYGGSSLSLPGTSGSGISVANPNTVYGSITGDFCIDAWIRMTALPSGGGGGEFQIFGQHSWPESVGSGNWWALFTITSGLQFYLNSGGGGEALSGPFTWATNTWYHVACTRSGSTVRLFVNGTTVGSTTSTRTLIVDNSRPLTIGADTGLDTTRFPGHIDELRFAKEAVWTADFTPPPAQYQNVAHTLGTPTLPGASGATGRYSFRNVSAQSVTIGTTSSQTINGATGGLTVANGASAELMSNGSAWFTF
jgi:hypothetical protein